MGISERTDCGGAFEICDDALIRLIVAGFRLRENSSGKFTVLLGVSRISCFFHFSFSDSKEKDSTSCSLSITYAMTTYNLTHISGITSSKWLTLKLSQTNKVNDVAISAAAYTYILIIKFTLSNLMELPNIGIHCSKKTCNQLDFLPYNCQFCRSIFCQLHWKKEDHNCASLNDPTIDVQVPVCPICQKPVPINRGEDPNVRMDEHISSNCLNPGTTTTPTLSPSSNICSLNTCKAKTLVQITCPTCRKNFCVKHRLESDHKCTAARVPGSSSGVVAGVRQTPAALAAIKRSAATGSNVTQTKGPSKPTNIANAKPGNIPVNQTTPQTTMMSTSEKLQAERERKQRLEQRRILEEKARKGLLSEDEQLALATQLSLEDANDSVVQHNNNNNNNNNNNCKLS